MGKMWGVLMSENEKKSEKSSPEPVENILIKEILQEFEWTRGEFRAEFETDCKLPEGFEESFRKRLQSRLDLPAKNGDSLNETHLNILYGVIRVMDRRNADFEKRIKSCEEQLANLPASLEAIVSE